MTTWVSKRVAAEAAGTTVSAIETHLDEIHHRPHRGSRPGIDLDSALAWAARQRAAQTARVPKPEPADESAPNDGDVWLDTTTAALVLGVTRVYVARLADHDRIPAVRRGRRWWLRRRDVEQRAAARALTTGRRET